MTRTEDSYSGARPQTVCADGFAVSIQGSEFHYCSPRVNNAEYSLVELGYPSSRPEPWSEWKHFAEEPENWAETVYPYVPVEMVIALVDSHNGAASLESPAPLLQIES